MTVNGKRNRAAGTGWERELAKIFRDLGFPHVVTTRSESRSRDAQKIDLINKDELKNGRLPYNVQAKNVRGHLQYGKVLSQLPANPGVINVILHKQTDKVGTKFITKNKYAIMLMDDFFTMVKKIKDYDSSTNGRTVVRAS